MDEQSLYEQLCAYGKSDHYPYHMPGHKRNSLGRLSADLLNVDITEIEGFDNLHQAEGILKKMQEKAAALYGAEESFFLINGSTCGILSAVSAALPQGGHLLMARDCHRSAYHAAYLRGLKTSYLYAETVAGFAFHEAVGPEQVERVLAGASDIGAVLIVSPTYEGRIADVGSIAEIAHKRGIPLIVDEAHGAHLGFAEGFGSCSCTQGADLVIHSVHKTLPAMTQTALLHVNGDLIDRDRLRRFLNIYQSSSPSYVLMASIEDALAIVEKQGEGRFRLFRERYKTLVESLQGCRYLRFVPWQDIERGRQDIGKLVIAARDDGVSGQWIYKKLLERYHLQCEMAAGNYCLAMFTIADGPEAYRRIGDALLELDALLEQGGRGDPGTVEEVFAPDGRGIRHETEALDGQEKRSGAGAPDGRGIRHETGAPNGQEKRSEAEALDGPGKAAVQRRCRVLLQDTDRPIPLSKAWDMPWKMTNVSDAVDHPVGNFINLYPPGIPLLAPGEILTPELYAEIQRYIEQGFSVQGIE